jgi:hypothetical protein
VLVVSILLALPLWVFGWSMFDRQLGSPTAAFRAYRCATHYMESLRLRDYEGVVKLSPNNVQVRFSGRADVLRYQFPEVASYSLTGMRVYGAGGPSPAYGVRFRFTPMWNGGDRVGLSLHEEAGRCVVSFPDSPV